MKKRRFAALTLLAPLLLLCSCGGGTPALNLSANWYSDTTAGTNLEGTYEQLEYDVTFTPPQTEEEYRVSYEDGKYVVTLASEAYTDGNGTSETVYHLHTVFSIAVKFAYGSVESERFEDSTVSDVLFRSAPEGLQPIRSEKRVKSHIPYSAYRGDPAKDAMYVVSDYTYSIVYDEGLTNAVYSYTDLGVTSEAEATPEEQNIKLGGTGTYLDNEQIFFALRGLDLTAGGQFRSIDPQTRQCVSLSLSQGTSTTAGNFSILDGEGNETAKAENIAAKTCTLSYRTAQPGPGRTLVYAQKVSVEDNTYRNVLLRIEYDIMNSFGTMRYDLVKATFTTR